MVHRSQFLLKPASARTIHSAQGTSMDNACIDLSNASEEGLHYVTLRRLRASEGLYFEKSQAHATRTTQQAKMQSAFAHRKIKTLPLVMVEIARLRQT